MSECVPTGIDGLDALIEGGFLRGDVILLAGGTGSGKNHFLHTVQRKKSPKRGLSDGRKRERL